MSKNKGKEKKKKDRKTYSGIEAHQRQKKVLVPPLMAIPGVALQSWVDDRLPEMLWCLLLISRFGRERALDRFRSVAALVPKLPAEKRTVRPTLSGLALLDSDVRQRFLSAICPDPETKNALRPLLLFEGLPARTEWASTIDQTPTTEDWEAVKAAVLPALDHQSQEATDCRWVKVLFLVLSGQLHLPTKEHAREILEYPNFGLPQRVRPSIRSMEGMIDQPRNTTSSWPQSFWDQCLKDTPCETRHTMETEWYPQVATTGRKVREVREALARHEKSCLDTSNVDARHDAVFGLGAYSLAILDELLSMGNSTAILGRLGLRTLLEIYVTLVHLKLRDDPALWTAYRQYGAGQAKLAFLKLDDPASSVPSSVNLEVLRQLANEDRWLEFVSIDLGHWAARDLRKLSEDSGVKPDYDRLYPWTSAFTHGDWAAVRNSCFDLCINPAHRLHRRLRSDTAELGDVVVDACELVDRILDTVNGLYPGFTMRVTLPESKSASPSGRTAGAAATKPALLATVQREFFEILDEFFRRATGGSAEEFAALDSFGEKIRADAQKLAPRAPQAYMYVHEALRAFYKRFGLHVFSEAKNLGGLKLVLGGTSHFGKAQFESVRKMLLYADTILIPDPILPWIESPRAEERFRSVQLLKTVFILLHFKAVVDADLPSPPILVVPSFEKSLEELDPTTQVRIGLLTTRVLSHFLGRKFDTFEELQEFAASKEAEFIRTVDEHSLFVAPGGHVGQPIRDALELYTEEIKQWRSESYQRALTELPKGLLLLNGLMERFAPQYHLIENAQELSSSPLVALHAHWHYYCVISKLLADCLEAQNKLDRQAMASLDLVQQPQQKWLGNVPLRDVVDLLLNRENEGFRIRLRQLVCQLREASVTDLNRVVPEVCRGVVSLLKEHEVEVLAIEEKYNSRHGESHVRQYVTAGASYMPTLAPTVHDFGQSVADEADNTGQTESQGEQGRSANSLLGMLGVADTKRR
jgi:hypothetical protein